MKFPYDFTLFLVSVSNVAGFIWVTDINFERYGPEKLTCRNATMPLKHDLILMCNQHSKKIAYLAPSAGNLPGKYLIAGNLTWCE